MANLTSEHVKREIYEYYSVTISDTASDEHRAQLLAELDVFRENYYGDEISDHPIMIINNFDGTKTHRFATAYSLTGNGLNPGVYDDIIDVAEIVQRGKRWLP